MARTITHKQFIKTELYRLNRFRWPIVLWIIMLTAGLLFTVKGLSPLEIIQSIAMTGVICFFSYFDIRYFNKKNLNLLPDLIKIGCLLLLILIFGYWGLVYTTFFLVILVLDAFSYSLRDFIIVLIMVAVAFGLIWYFHDDPIYQSTIVKNTLFLIISNAIFALGILLRTFARESLSLKQRERDLEKSQEALKKENFEINAILNNMENAVFSIDKDNNIYFANKSAINTFPIFREKSFNKITLDKIQLIDSLGKQISLEDILKESDKKRYRSDLSANIKGETISYNSFITKIYDSDDNYNGAMISLHSLTADEMLEKRKIEFTSLASHEIRTPLTVMEGYLYLLMTNKEFEYNKLTKDYITILYDTTSDLIKLSNGILSMTKIDEGSVRVDLEDTNLQDIIKEVIDEQIKMAKSRGLDINSVINKVPIIQTDPIKVKEIARNLIENAIKFSVKGTIAITLDQEGEEIIMSVEDTGIGIPEDSRDKIFGKFYQVENWETRKNSGSGIGLYVSRSLARRIGGDLLLESTSKKGSKFTLLLPVKYPNIDDIKKEKEHKLKEFIEGF